MKIIGIFIVLAAIGREIKHAVLFIDALNVFTVERPAGDLIFQFPIFIIQIKMRPAIGFTPLNKFFAAIYKTNTAVLNISVHSFRHKRTRRVGIDIHHAEVDPFQIAAGAAHIKFIIGTLPERGAALIIPFFLQRRSAPNTYFLIFECSNFQFFAGLFFKVEQVYFTQRCFFFTGHLVFVGFQCGPRVSNIIDHPKVFYLAAVGA